MPGKVAIPAGEKVTLEHGTLRVPDHPISCNLTGGLEKTFQSKVVTYELARLPEGAIEVKCAEFATAIIQNLARL
jgi:isocitrate dehydrogenase